MGVQARGQMRAKITGDRNAFINSADGTNAVQEAIAEVLGGGVTAEMVDVTAQADGADDEVLLSFDIEIPLGPAITLTAADARERLAETDMSDLLANVQSKLPAGAAYSIGAATGAGDDKAVVTGLTIQVPNTAGTAGTGDEEAFAHSQIACGLTQLGVMVAFFLSMSQ